MPRSMLLRQAPGSRVSVAGAMRVGKQRVARSSRPLLRVAAQAQQAELEEIDPITGQPISKLALTSPVAG